MSEQLRSVESSDGNDNEGQRERVVGNGVFERAILQGVYSQLFMHPDSPDATKNIEKLCAAMSAVNSTNEESARLQIEKCLSKHYRNSSPGNTGEYSLHLEQWSALKVAFTHDDYKDLRKITGSPGTPDQDTGVMSAGPYELAYIYHCLFGRPSDRRAHIYLHRLKAAARKNDVERVRAQLDKVYNDYFLAGGGTPGVPVELQIDEVIIKQMMGILRNSDFEGLEPYEGVPCKGDLTGLKCY